MDRRSRRFPVLAACLVWASAATAEVIRVPTVDESVRLVVERPFAPAAGHAPMEVHIQNQSGRDRVWRFGFVSASNGGVTRRSQHDIAVPHGESRSFELMVPMAAQPEGRQWSSLQMEIDGYGVVGGYSYPLSYGSAAQSQFTVSESLKEHLVVTQLGGGQSSEPDFTFDPKVTPKDWRGWSSRTRVWMTSDDFRSMPGAGRRALAEWVAQGGRLAVFTVRGVTPARLELPAAEGLSRQPVASFGFGTVYSEPLPVEPGTAAAAGAAAWASTVGNQDRSPSGVSYPDWAVNRVGEIELRTGLLALFLFAYLILIGPVNIYVFARHQRQRLFWTMPALSFAATGFLTLLILLQDGVGGRGQRVTAVFLLPELNREAVFQEQASRTGMLLGTRFALPPNAAAYQKLGTEAVGSVSVASAGLNYTGEWFRSRSVQTQVLSEVRPSRGRIERASSGTVDGQPPALVSNLEDALVQIHYRDRRGGCWAGTEIVAGRSTSLRAASPEECTFAWTQAYAEAGPQLQRRLSALMDSRDVYIARADASSSEAPIDSLGGIRWNESTLLYLGRLGD